MITFTQFLNERGVVFSLVATGAANGNDALGSITFQEIT